MFTIESVAGENVGPHRSFHLTYSPGGNVVVGPVDVGKSIIVTDALTWCLWGRSRFDQGRSRRPDDLVRLDPVTGERADKMWVRTILRTWDGRRLRIDRARKHGGKPSITMQDLTTGRPVETTGSGARDMQQAVIDAIGETYEQFCLLHWVNQKRPLAWTHDASDKDREEILQTFVDLTRFRTWGEQSGKRVWAAQEEIRRTTEAITALGTPQTDLDTANKQIGHISHEIAGIEDEISAKREQIAAIREQIAVEEAAADEHQRRVARLAVLTNERSAHTAAMNRLTDQQATDQQIAATEPEIRAGVALLRELREQLAGLATLTRTRSELQQRCSQAEGRALIATRSRKQSELSRDDHREKARVAQLAADRAAEAVSGIDVEALRAELATAERTADEVAQVREQYAAATVELRSAEGRLRELEADRQMRAQAHRSQLQRLEDEHRRAHGDAALADGVPCAGMEDLQVACQFLARAVERRGAIPDLERQINELRDHPVTTSDEEEAQHDLVNELRTRTELLIEQGRSLTDGERIESIVSALRQRIDRAVSLRADRDRHQSVANIALERAADAEHAARQFGAQVDEYTADVADCERQLADITTRIATFEDVSRQAAELEFADPEGELEAVTAAAARIPERAARIEQVSARIEELSAEITQLQAQIAGYSDAALEQLQEQAAMASAAIGARTALLQRVRTELDAAKRAAALAEDRLQRLTGLQADLATAEQTLQIRRALGRVYASTPKIVLENLILPEIERTVADVYQRIMGGRVTMVTQREQKTSDRQKEVLEVLVNGLPAQALGGTASMTLELAWRYAVQRVLLGPGRALLLFDEGNLGHLDDQHQALMVDALRKFEQLGQCVLITHLPRFKSTYNTVIDFGRGDQATEAVEETEEVAA